MMMLGVLTAVHVAISLLAIAAGFVVVYGLLTARGSEAWTKFFLASTAATSLTGFLFPFNGFTPADGVGILSLIVLIIAALARYRFGLAGGWRKTYVITAMIALYFNVFVLIAQSFQKVPALKALAPTQSELPFQIAQLALVVIFGILGFSAVAGLRKERRPA
jgi:hypothetical protein